MVPLQVLLFMLMMFVLLLHASIHSVMSRFFEIDVFTSDVGLRLNTSKLELIQVSQTQIEPIQVQVGDHLLTTKKSARCLGIQWQSSLSASESVKTNISKARKAFFGLGSTGVFHGKLNPLSESSVFEVCIIPIRESVDSLCRDGTDTPIVCVH